MHIAHMNNLVFALTQHFWMHITHLVPALTQHFRILGFQTWTQPWLDLLSNKPTEYHPRLLYIVVPAKHSLCMFCHSLFMKPCITWFDISCHNKLNEPLCRQRPSILLSYQTYTKYTMMAKATYKIKRGESGLLCAKCMYDHSATPAMHKDFMHSYC